MFDATSTTLKGGCITPVALENTQTVGRGIACHAGLHFECRAAIGVGARLEEEPLFVDGTEHGVCSAQHSKHDDARQQLAPVRFKLPWEEVCKACNRDSATQST